MGGIYGICGMVCLCTIDTSLAVGRPIQKDFDMSTIPCPSCGKSTRSERYCQYCGEPFYVSDTKQGPSSSCMCGAVTSPDAKYCPICGGAVQQVSIGLDNISGKYSGSIVPDSVRGWNWGAFFLTWIWGLGNRTYIAFVCFVPIVNLIWPFVLGEKGSEWAWRNKRWDSPDHFLKIQRRWAVSGLVIALICVAILIPILLLL